MSRDLITIRILEDQMVAEMYRDILGQEGIVAMIPGAQHRGMLGMLGAYIEIPLKVQAEDAERAAEILAAIETEVGVGEGEDPDEAKRGGPAEEDTAGRDGVVSEAMEDHNDEDEGALEASAGRPKLKRIAFFIAFAIPGGGHFYVRWWLHGLLFLLAELVVGLLLVASGETMLALTFYPGMVLADALGAVSRVEEANGGPMGRGLRVRAARGLPLVPIVVALGLYFGSEHAADWYVGRSGITVCTRLRHCASDTPSECTVLLSRGLRRMLLERSDVERCGACMGANTCTVMQQECGSWCREVWRYLDDPPLPVMEKAVFPTIPLSLDLGPLDGDRARE